MRLRHFNILGTYGLSRQRSRLNSFSGRLEKIPIDIRPKDLLRRPRIQIIKIDENKNRIGLKELYSDRRRLYSMKTIRDFALLLIVFILSELFYSGIIYKVLIRIIFSISLIYTATTVFSFLFEKSKKRNLYKDKLKYEELNAELPKPITETMQKSYKNGAFGMIAEFKQIQLTPAECGR